MKRKILVVEDDVEVRTQIARLLELNDYDTLTASNGILGLQEAITQLPDLIISDIMMPELDGFELLSELQKYPETITIPFLFLTARTERNDIRKGMKLGADDYLMKPFSFSELLDAVKTQLIKSEATKQRYNEKFEELRNSIRLSLPHEIRTPLNSILGYCDILLKKISSKQSDLIEMVNHIHSSARRLNILFEKFLFYVNVEIAASNPAEAEKLRQKRTPSAETIIGDISKIIANQNDRPGDLELLLEEAIPHISESYFIKLIEELVDNAFKIYQKNTRVSIKSKKNNDKYLIGITDHGRGMTQEQLKNTGAYIQYDRKIYEQQGTGLGLTLVKRLLDIHGGTITLDSEPEYFTTISITLDCD